MAWPKDKREIIEFLEDSMVEVLYVWGYLDGLGQGGDAQAVRCGEKLKTTFDRWRMLRLGQFRQLGFFDESED